ncbi:histone H3-like centromeric protein CENH3 isoform X2 [Populus trichocarpa]|uniref:histone H3-like centromeric protein CENH3 isoform X2 n=1 Tax=Populus trichocarpa TaxID=3694 RepID=UPI0022798C0D|nr:histone H3-like centromeric protein CENH3 isoform X2 [Populus trichocarpa]
MARTKHPVARKRARSPKRSDASPSTPRTPTSSRTRPQANGQQGSSTQRQRKKHRFRSGTVALREIRQYQKTWRPLIPAASFIRFTRCLFIHDIEIPQLLTMPIGKNDYSGVFPRSEPLDC